MSTGIELRTGDDGLSADLLVDLYQSVGWAWYAADGERLQRAIAGSTWVATAWDGDTLVGLARGVSDDVAIFYLQDILVRPTHHRRGVGRLLLERGLERFAHVRQKVLLTDDQQAQRRFYESMGYTRIGDVSKVTLHAFLRIEGVELS